MLLDSSSKVVKSKVSCKFFASGTCKYGDDCRFLHISKDRYPDVYLVSKEDADKNKKDKVSKAMVGNQDSGSQKSNNKPVKPGEFYKKSYNTSSNVENNQVEIVSSEDLQEDKLENYSLAQSTESKTLCRFYAKGYCFRGSKCAFLHEKRKAKMFKKMESPINEEAIENPKMHDHLVDQSLNEERIIEIPNASEKIKNSGIRNFYNNRKSYFRQYSVPKSVRESQQRLFRPTVEKKPEELRMLEIDLLLKKFPEALKVSEKDNSTFFQFNFVPSDPDWPFDVKEIELLVEFPAKYPLEALKLNLGENQAIPDPVKCQLDEAISNWITEKYDSSTLVDLMFRPLLRWLDRSIEDLLIEALKKYKRDLVLASSGIQIILADQLREKYKGAVTGSGVANEKDNAAAKAENQLSQSNDLDADDFDSTKEAKTEFIAISESNVKKGTEVRLNDLCFSGIATLLCSKFKVIMACGRCKNKIDVSGSVPTQSGSATFSISCPYCFNKGLAQFNRCIIHENDHTMGHFDLEGCHVADVLLSDCEFLAGCFNCMKNMLIKSLYPGQQSDTWCMDCHHKMSVKVNNVKVIRLGSNAPLGAGGQSKASAQVETDKRPKSVKDPSIQDGNPLPMFGTCKHYKKSFRWFRFPCCGKAYPCNLCHEEAESHEMKLANRIICGFCAMEQPYSPSNPCIRCGGHVTNKFTSHWEGGKGCRDKIRMSRLDAKKYSNCSKTSTSKKKQQNNKTTKLRDS